MIKARALILQTLLTKAGFNTKGTDGVLGRNSWTAIEQFRNANVALFPQWASWPDKRRSLATLQLCLSLNGFDAGPIDGLNGTRTENALFAYQQAGRSDAVINWQDLEPIQANPHDFPIESTQNLNAFYGEVKLVRDPTTGKLDRRKSTLLREEDLAKVTCPWTLRLDWDLTKKRSFIKVHKKLETSLKTVLTAIYDHYGDDGVRKHGLDRFSGDYNPRLISGGSRPSTHSWGIAIDFYGSKNRLRQSTFDAVPPTLAHPELAYFWEQWEKEGWYSLGRSKNYDWMHVQAAKRA